MADVQKQISCIQLILFKNTSYEIPNFPLWGTSGVCKGLFPLGKNGSA
jgi:hypothetical protein